MESTATKTDNQSSSSNEEDFISPLNFANLSETGEPNTTSSIKTHKYLVSNDLYERRIQEIRKYHQFEL